MSQSTSFKQGGYVTDGSGYAKLLVEINNVFLRSVKWFDPEDREVYEKQASEWMTPYELESDDWSPCTPKEAGVPDEKWVPKHGETVYRAIVDHNGEIQVQNMVHNENCSYNHKQVHIGNLHRTEELALNWAKKRYNIS